MEWIDDNGFELNGGSQQISGDNVPTFNKKYFNNNQIADGAIVSGRNNIVSSGDGVIVSGESNVVGIGSTNVSILASTGVTILGGVSNVSVTNSSGITVTESNVTYINGIKTLNNVSYKHYIALLYQTGTSDPTAYVLENTLSSGITWVRDAVGEYLGTLTGEFTQYKTAIFCNNTYYGELLASRKNSNVVQVYTFDSSGTATDGQLNYNTIEIRVYS